MAISKDTQPTLSEIQAEATELIGDFQSTLTDFAKRIQAMAKEFNLDNWILHTYEDLEGFHLAVQQEMSSLDTDYEILQSVVFDLEGDLTTWSDLKDEGELDTKDEEEMEAADSNYRRDA